jgi:hypothetical protein
MTIKRKYYEQFSEIQSLIQTTKQRIYSTVNTALIDLYWQIGAYVHNKINSSEWGKSVVQDLSDYILKNEPGSKGFSAQNI